MAAAARVTDTIQGGVWCPCGLSTCWYDVTGNEAQGSPNVFINGNAVIRVGDGGNDSAPCGRTWFTNIQGSHTVFANGQPVVRQGDPVNIHVDNDGQVVSGSPNVFVGG